MASGQVDGSLDRIDSDRPELLQAADELVEEVTKPRIAPTEMLLERFDLARVPLTCLREPASAVRTLPQRRGVGRRLLADQGT
jgi:hypothetical protein